MKVISSLDHPLIKHLVKLRTDREYRYEKQSAIIIGQKLIREMSSYADFKAVIVEQGTSFPDFSQVYEVPRSLLKKITGVENPEPIAAEVAIPPFQQLNNKQFLVIFDGVADPGNLGTLLRTALALNWEGAFFAPHCTDPFNEKAIRAAKGATFQLPLQMGSWDEIKKIIHENKMQVYLGDVKGSPLNKIKFQKPLALILSNESQGASDEAKALATPITIPINPKMESLNVASAGAILMYEMRHL